MISLDLMKSSEVRKADDLSNHPEKTEFPSYITMALFSNLRA